MATFKVNVPVAQDTAEVKVEGTDSGDLPLGPNRFSLVVVDDSGNLSEPFILTVTVVDTDKPTAVLQVVNSDGKVLDPTVQSGQTFILSGAASQDKAPGTIKEYRFTLLDRA
uniref:hypothetical protein n=1 Tax=Altererythrobacter segetis TaxID=1104773 RepID=UPI001409ECB5|nr:hypothetical protein [Altererythrobacter segetis]